MKTLLPLLLLLTFSSFGQEKPELKVNIGHSDGILSVCFSPDGKYVLSGGKDASIILWGKNTGKVIRTFSEHSSVVRCVVFSPDGKYALSGSDDKTLKLWEISTGKEIRSFSGHTSGVLSVCFSPDGKYALSGSYDKTLKLWEVSTGKEIRTFSGHTAWVCSVCISPDGRYALSSCIDNTIKLWDISSGKEIKSFSGHTEWASSVCFSPDGNYFLSGSNDGFVKLWEMPTCKEIRTYFPKSSYIRDVAFSSDGKYFLSSGKDIVVIDVNTGSEIQRLEGYSNSACFSQDDKYVLSGSEDKTLRLWDLANGNLVRTFSESPNRVLSACLSPDGRYILSATIDLTVKLWDLSTGKVRLSYSGHKKGGGATSVCFSPNSKLALTQGFYQKIKLWDIETSEEIRTFQGVCSGVNSVSFSPDGKHAISYKKDSLFYFEISSGKVVKIFTGHKKNIQSACFSPDGNLVLTGSSDRTLKLWNIKTGSEILSFNTNYFHVPTTICFSPDSKHILSGARDIKLWDIHKAIEMKTFSGKEKYNPFIKSLSFTNDGSSFIAGSEDKTIKLWDIKSGSVINTFYGHVDDVISVSFFPNDRYFFSASKDGTIKIWNRNTGHVIGTLYSFDKTEWVIVSPDGRFDASEGGMKYLYYVQGLDIIPLESFFEQFYTPNLLARVMSGEQFEKTEIDLSQQIKLPPLVKITSPENHSKLNNKELTVNVKVTDQGGGIDEIRLYHNGKMVQTTQRGFKKIEQKEEVTTKTFSIQLVNGKNIIKATAFNNQRTEAIPDEISIFYKGAATTSNLYVFILGINNYKNPKYKLNYANADAIAFKQEIEKGSKDIFGNTYIEFVQDENATRTKILQVFDNLKSKTKAEDVFIFYFAGHGVMSEEEKSEFYIVPYDITQLYGNNQMLQTKAISAAELQNFSRELKAQKQLFVFDACQSGGMVELLASRGAAEEKAIAQLARSTGTFWLTASNTEQFATEFATLGHGIFTYALLLGLQGQADGGSKDKKITVKELSSFLNDKVPELSEKHKGQAQYPTSYGYGQDFPVVIIK